jgi:DNA-binding beta-propeller fold protein YncE
MRVRMLAIVLVAALGLALVTQAGARQVLLVSTNTGWSKYDCATGAYLGLLRGVSGTRVVAAEPGGILDVYAGNSILRYDVDSGRSLGGISLLGYFGGCEGMTLGPDGCLYLANTGSNRILRCDTSTGAVEVVPLAAGITQPFGIAFGSDGDLYACAYLPNPSGWGREIGRIMLSDGSLVERYQGTKDLQSPMQLASTPDGSIYALNQCLSGLYELNRAAGRFDEIVPGGPLLGFQNMVFGSGNAAFLTQYDYYTSRLTVQRYDLQTGGLSYFAPGGTGYLAIATVPEPSGALMLATALGCLVGALRSRRCVR